MKEAIQKDIIETFKNLNAILFLFSQEEFNIIPGNDCWSAGQTAQHLILACSGYPKLFSGRTQETDRKYDEKVKDIKALFLNFDIKMDSPDFLKPAAIDYNKDSLSSTFHHIESDLLHAAETMDLTLTCLDFELPGFGKFTIFEWISFALIHIQRHTKQLNNIFKQVAKS
ncbi:DinB family protein [Flavobacterium sp. JAS]|uniref:DinB family protein n=1 Tax=Flavobacterium sp. JAS TaxID=2897329 RepID=UPI001E4E6516|nr:DinB family protein [Flavobacterium sp. JAS]MCD0468844.1 DinB family protein [Flavobacterium sp. JAS]